MNCKNQIKEWLEPSSVFEFVGEFEQERFEWILGFKYHDDSFFIYKPKKFDRDKIIIKSKVEVLYDDLLHPKKLADTLMGTGLSTFAFHQPEGKPIDTVESKQWIWFDELEKCILTEMIDKVLEDREILVDTLESVDVIKPNLIGGKWFEKYEGGEK